MDAISTRWRPVAPIQRTLPSFALSWPSTAKQRSACDGCTKGPKGAISPAVATAFEAIWTCCWSFLVLSSFGAPQGAGASHPQDARAPAPPGNALPRPWAAMQAAAYAVDAVAPECQRGRGCFSSRGAGPARFGLAIQLRG
eukprot:9479363-Pyramimonas_sp.AAC.1